MLDTNCSYLAALLMRYCYAANERTFLGWLSMATTVGGISTALAGYTNAVEKQTSGIAAAPWLCITKPKLTTLPFLVRYGAFHAAGKRTISENTSQLITIILLPIAIVMIAYAMTTYFFRSRYMQKKQVGHTLGSTQHVLPIYVGIRDLCGDP